MAGGGAGRVSEGRTVQKNVSLLLFWSPAGHPHACLSSAARSLALGPTSPSHPLRNMSSPFPCHPNPLSFTANDGGEELNLLVGREWTQSSRYFLGTPLPAW